MGIHRRSIYDTYANKLQLYLKVLEMNIREKFKAIFDYSAFPNSNCSKDCLIVNSAIEIALRNTEVSHQVQLFFENTKSFFVDLLRQAKENGELSNEDDIIMLASYLNNALIGIRVLVKCSPSQKELENVIQTTLSVL